MAIQKVTSLDEYRKIAKDNQSIIIMFTAEWCGPCKVAYPRFQKKSDEFKNTTFISADVDHAQDLSTEFGIKAMPTFIAIENGEKKETLIGGDLRNVIPFLERYAKL